MYLLGIDIGTSSTKSAVFDTKGNILGLAAQEYVFETSRPGYAEQDPEDWWKAVVISVRNAVRVSGVSQDEIVAIGLSGQMHGMVPLDLKGQVIRKAILHCDVRAAEEVEEIKKEFGHEYESITFNPVFPGFQAVSLYWLRKWEPESYRKLYRVVCPKDYIRYRMTGKIGTEHTDASGTLLYDMKKSVWSPELFQMLELDMSIVPREIARSYEIAGNLTKEAAEQLGLSGNTLVAYGGADQAMQSVGNGIYQAGTTMATIGTSGQVLRISNIPVYNQDMNTHTFRHVNDNTWYGLGALLFAGSTLNWFRRNFCEDQSYEDLSTLAAAVSPGSDGLVFFPCMGGERTPYLDPKAKGMFCGLTMVHNKAHFARAIMEGISFEMKLSIEKIESLYGLAEKCVCAGGGVKGSVWPQIQADIYNKDISISAIKEQACLGAAIMAGIGAGVFSDMRDACESMCDRLMTVVSPNEENSEKYQWLYKEVFRQLYESNAKAFHKINDFTE